MEQALRAGVDPFKGLLILLVILDHNDQAHALLPRIMDPMTFHVLGFLLLPFLLPGPSLSKELIMDRFARYWIPHAFVVTLAALLFWMLYRRADSIAAMISAYALAIVFGSAPLIKQATGFLAYWFLPTLFGLVVTLAAYRAASANWRWTLLAFFIACHCFLTAGNFPAYRFIPFGLAIAANVFVLGLLLKAIVASKAAYAVRWIAPAIFVVSYGALAWQQDWLEVALLGLAPVTQLRLFLLQDIAGLSGVLTVLLAGNALARHRAIASIGRHSLMIYLIHPPAYIAIVAVEGVAGIHVTSLGGDIAVGAFNFVLAVVASWAAAVVIARTALLRDWITPRRWCEWKPLTAIRGLRAI